jgi:hypothetical protein
MNVDEVASEMARMNAADAERAMTLAAERAVSHLHRSIGDLEDAGRRHPDRDPCRARRRDRRSAERLSRPRRSTGRHNRRNPMPEATPAAIRPTFSAAEENAMPVVSVSPAAPTVPAPSLPPVSVDHVAIKALLDDPIPPDVRDPAAIARREQALEAAAHAAAAAMVKLMTRLNDERRLGMHMAAGGCVDRAIIEFQHDNVRYDGLDGVRATIEREFGTGIADLTMASLASLRTELGTLIRETLQQ